MHLKISDAASNVVRASSGHILRNALFQTVQERFSTRGMDTRVAARPAFPQALSERGSASLHVHLSGGKERAPRLQKNFNIFLKIS